MALPPKFSGQKFPPDSPNQAVHTLELYLDYVCPFSAKLFYTFYNSVLPLIKSKYPDKLQIIFRQQIQPWHPSSTLVHEAGAAVLRLDPDKFWKFSAALFGQQKSYFDVNVVNETRNRTYERLTQLAGSVGLDEKKVYELLAVGDEPDKDGGLNVGNGVTDDIKFMVKANRLTGVHVTPTCLFNGVVENSISSSFTEEQWEDWLQKNIV